MDVEQDNVLIEMEPVKDGNDTHQLKRMEEWIFTFFQLYLTSKKNDSNLTWFVVPTITDYAAAFKEPN